MNKFLLLLIAFSVIFSTGCSSSVTVKGTVKYPDGEPLTRGIVFFQNAARTLMYQGTLQPDGSFALGVLKDGDGIPPGDYLAWISNANTDFEIIIDPKYVSPQTSGLTYSIDTKRSNIEIIVERPSGTRKPPLSHKPDLPAE